MCHIYFFAQTVILRSDLPLKLLLVWLHLLLPLSPVSNFPQLPPWLVPSQSRLPSLDLCTPICHLHTAGHFKFSQELKTLHQRGIKSCMTVYRPPPLTMCLPQTSVYNLHRLLLCCAVLHICTHVTITPMLITLLLNRSCQPWKSQMNSHLLQYHTSTQNQHTQLFSLWSHIPVSLKGWVPGASAHSSYWTPIVYYTWSLHLAEHPVSLPPSKSILVYIAIDTIFSVKLNQLWWKK